MTRLSPWTLDFETEPIDFANPHRAPKPVGLAVRYPGPNGKLRYCAWGHLTGNNSHRMVARYILEHAWRDRRPLLFHNAQFDLAVARQHFGLPWPDASRIEDTRVLAFLADSYRERLGLKELAEDLLGKEPTERDKLYDWIRANVPEARRKANVGAWIGRAPGDLVAPYAIGDVTRTYDLWRLFAPVRKAFPTAYRLEIEALEVAQALTEEGVPVDVPALEAFAEAAPRQLDHLARAIRRMLRLEAGCPLSGDSGRNSIVHGIEARGWMGGEEQWVRTGKTKVVSLAADDLALVLAGNPAGEKFVALWRAYQLGGWQLRTLVRPWLERVTSAGRVHVSWDTTRNAERGKLMGARTGRMSSTPNLQNVGKADPSGGLTNPRTWIKAPRGFRLVGGDLSQQEPRITAHFSGGSFLDELRENHRTDFHSSTATIMSIPRESAKTLGLAVTYALGLDALARRLGRSRQEAQALRFAFYRARPEIAELDRQLRLAWATGQAIVTWAGAEVKCEATPEEPGRWAYRALNTLIQRSAAEQLKRAMVTAHRAGVPLCLSVHDELVACVPRADAPDVGKRLQDALEHTDEWRVPFVADVQIGTTWRSLK